MLELQKYLREGHSLEELQESFGVKSTPHVDYPHLYGFKYHQLDSPAGEKIVQESRGVILDSSRDWEIVAQPFHRFFNYGEGYASDIDWGSASVMEKYDGSLITLYYYAKRWHVATSGNPAASGPVCRDTSGTWKVGEHELPKPRSFAEYFWQVMLYKYSFPHDICKCYCYMFELMGPLNRIVVKHDEPKLVLLGAREIRTGKDIHLKGREVHLKDIHTLCPGLPIAEQYRLSDIDEILSTFKNMSPLSQEGYVVVDNYFNRIKIKSPAYIALHHAKDGFTLRKIVTIALTGEASEVITAFPEYKPDFEDAKNRLENLILELEEEYDKIKDIESQKEFAMRAVRTKCSAALFKLRAGKVKSIREFLANINIDKLMLLLGY